MAVIPSLFPVIQAFFHVIQVFFRVIQAFFPVIPAQAGIPIGKKSLRRWCWYYYCITQYQLHNNLFL
jgi:hypothetical protein